MRPTVKVRPRESFSDDELEALRHWLEDAYGDLRDSWRVEHWTDLPPGPHLTIEHADGELLAHACLCWISVEVGNHRLLAGYVEDVATRADVRRRGYGTALMTAARPLIEEHAEIGLLGTGEYRFYEHLGWIRWGGPTSVLEDDGTVTRTPEDDDAIMALFVPRTPPGVSTDLPISRRRRDPEEAW